ncbi:hypothetical protein FCOIX_12884 [Fusarium coicis]|nr:hypothetical protein FCOIX_12884 [Fusarium coicis]
MEALLSLRASTSSCRAVEDDAEANVTATGMACRHLQKLSKRHRVLNGFVGEAQKLKCSETTVQEHLSRLGRTTRRDAQLALLVKASGGRDNCAICHVLQKKSQSAQQQLSQL